MRANFSIGGKAKTVEVVVFNQQMNPQSSIKAFFNPSWIKEFKPKQLLSTNFLAIAAFVSLLLLVFLQGRLCSDYNRIKTEEEEILKSIASGQVTLDPSDINSSEKSGIIYKICKTKDDFVVTLGVAFLLLTVFRQFVIRFQAKKDRM